MKQYHNKVYHNETQRIVMNQYVSIWFIMYYSGICGLFWYSRLWLVVIIIYYIVSLWNDCIILV